MEQKQLAVSRTNRACKLLLLYLHVIGIEKDPHYGRAHRSHEGTQLRTGSIGATHSTYTLQCDAQIMLLAHTEEHSNLLQKQGSSSACFAMALTSRKDALTIAGAER